MIKNFVRKIGFGVFFPITWPWKVVRSQHHFLVKALTVLLAFQVLLPLWIVLGIIIGVGSFYSLRLLAFEGGLVEEISYVSGTGSMYPTFPKGKGKTNIARMQEVAGSARARRYPGGIEIFGKRYFGYELQRGDIVFFNNDKTRAIISRESSGSADINTGFVKRVIAISGNKLEIRDGFVWINGSITSEPYTAKARSTYGGDFLPDCKPIIIAPGYIFVMGDNRKGSNDSRFDLELVSLADVRRVIPLSQQGELKAHWRDTSHDADNANKPVLDTFDYLALLNQKRKDARRPPLRYQEKLAQSAEKRAKIILKYNDFSFEATKSAYTMEKAMQEVGYSNIVWGEITTAGFYEADELIDNYFEFPQRRNFLINADFQETGLGAVVGEISGCPVQVVVQHLAGYVPPNYKKEDIESWRQAVSRLKAIQPSWENLKINVPFYEANKGDVDRITAIINERIDYSTKIVSRMEANEWLTAQEKAMIGRDKQLYSEQEDLASKLNNKVNEFNHP